MKIDKELQKIRQFAQIWELKKNNCRQIYQLEGRVNIDDITYTLPTGHRIIDYGLLFDIEPYKFKAPTIFLHLWQSSQNECIKLINDLIFLEQKRFKEGGISDEELGYICSIKNIVHYVLKNRFKTDDITTRKVIGGNYKERSHFTVNLESKDKGNEK